MKTLFHFNLKRTAVADVAITAGQLFTLRVLNSDAIAVVTVPMAVLAADVVTHSTLVPFIQAKLQAAFYDGGEPVTSVANSTAINIAAVLPIATPELGSLTLTIAEANVAQYEYIVDAVEVPDVIVVDTKAQDMLTGAFLGYATSKLLS